MPEETYQQQELQQMKFLATALLGVALIIFIIASIFEEQYIWAGFVRATAEAAMVGAIADWFAVTALFRHPLGLKIPHTAIIPQRKDIIGQTFGRFVKNNFLTEEVVADKLHSMDISQRTAEWLSQPENSALVASYATVAIAAIAEVIKDEEVQDLIEQNLITRIRATQFAPFLGHTLSLVTSSGRQRELLKGTVRLGAYLLTENRAAIEQKISQELPWWLPKNISHKIYEKLVHAVETTAREVNTNPNHSLYARFSLLIDRFVEELKHSPEMLAREEALKEELLQHAVVREFSASLWLDLKRSLLEGSSNPDLDVRSPIQQSLTKIGETILRDETLLKKINRWVEDGAIYIIKEYGHEVELLISQTISRWDAAATSRKVELQIGKDLQYVRINGTVVGGLIGLLIHTCTFVIQQFW